MTWHVGANHYINIRSTTGVNHEPTAGCVANLPNWACSIFRYPKWGALAGKVSWLLRTFYIPEVGPGSEVKLTGRYVPAGQLSVESENRRCSHPGFSAPACRTYDIKSIRIKTIDAYTCFVYPFVKSNIDASYTKCNLIATSMQYLELYEINAYHRLKLWHKTITGNCRGLHRRIYITLRIFSQIVWIIPQWSVIFPRKVQQYGNDFHFMTSS